MMTHWTRRKYDPWFKSLLFPDDINPYCFQLRNFVSKTRRCTCISALWISQNAVDKREKLTT